MAWVAPLVLEGRHIRLEPLRADHAAGLREAVADGEIWKIWYTAIPAPDQIEAEIARRLAEQEAGRMLPFVSCALDGRVLGMTTYMNITPAHRRLEIGSTFLRGSAQRSGANVEAKFLMLRHGFEALECQAIELRTHAMNIQSRAAIERLGAKMDGILRGHMILPNGTSRDTCVYSILAHEWPAVRAGLEARMARA
ncbi:MAG: GNAT family N-acetyltransferase [Paracoccaceae bacterium]